MNLNFSSGVIFTFVSLFPLPLFPINPATNNQPQERITMKTDEPTKTVEKTSDKEISKTGGGSVPSVPLTREEKLKKLLAPKTPQLPAPARDIRLEEAEKPEKAEIEFHVRRHKKSLPIWISDKDGRKIAAELYLVECEINLDTAHKSPLRKVTFGVVSVCDSENLVSWSGPIPYDVKNTKFIQDGGTLRMIYGAAPDAILVCSLLPNTSECKKTKGLLQTENILRNHIEANFLDAYLFCGYDSSIYINLQRFFRIDFFGWGSLNAAPPPNLRCTNVVVEKGIFCIEIENPTALHLGKIWLDIDKKEIIKFEENIHPIPDIWSR